MGHVGVEWVMQGWGGVGHVGVKQPMKKAPLCPKCTRGGVGVGHVGVGWDGSCRGGWGGSCRGGVGHVGVGWVM